MNDTNILILKYDNESYHDKNDDDVTTTNQTTTHYMCLFDGIYNTVKPLV